MNREADENGSNVVDLAAYRSAAAGHARRGGCLIILLDDTLRPAGYRFTTLQDPRPNSENDDPPPRQS